MSQAVTVPRPRATFGWSGFALGAAALMLAVVLFWAGPLATPDPDASLADRMAETARSLIGKTEVVEPVAAPGRTIDDWLRIAVAGLSGLAVILGLAGLALREPPRPAFSAVTLGGGTLLFQLVTVFALALVCLLLFGGLARQGDSLGDILSGVLEAISGFFSAIGDFFSSLFDGWFGG